MNKSFKAICVPAVLLAAAVFLLAETVVVKIQTTNLRKDPKFYAETLGVLKAGDSLEKLGSREAWIQVRTSKGAVGWIHSSAVEAKKFKLSALDKNLRTQATAGEVALAGKGFNEQVEQSYRVRHGESGYAAMEKMLQIKVSTSEVLAFLKKGKLGEFGGSK